VTAASVFAISFTVFWQACASPDGEVPAPRYFIAGDSIAMAGWGPEFVKLVGEEQAFVYPENLRWAANAREIASDWAERAIAEDWDRLILGGIGLWGLELEIPLDEYELQIDRLFAKIRSLPFKRVYVLTVTPVYPLDPDAESHEADQVNEILVRSAQSHDLPVIDLAAFCKEYLGPEAYADRLHFNEQAHARQAAFIYAEIAKLERRL
jgi:hypothetical protein